MTTIIYPNSTIPCTAQSWVGSISTRKIDKVFDNNFSHSSEPWHPIVPSRSKTWIIYKFNIPVSITDVKLSFYTGDQLMTVKIYKNVNTQYNSVLTSVNGYSTSYRTLITPPSDDKLIYEKENFPSRIYTNDTYKLLQKQDNVSNLYIEFSSDTFIFEIQFLDINSTNAYIKSENGEIDLYKYEDYELTIYPVNGRALSVQSSRNIVDKTITFNNLIRYDYKNRKVSEFKNNTWTEIPNYFSSNYTGIKIYENNLYSSAKADILNPSQFDLSKPWLYMMYGPEEDVSRVTEITLQNNIYTFTSNIGKVEFDNKGNPLSSYKKVIGFGFGFLPDTNPFKFVVYKYNGYSQMTKEYLTDLWNNLLSNYSGCINSPTQQMFYSGNCGPNIGNWNIYIYGGPVGLYGNDQRTVHKIYVNKNDPNSNWDILFFISDDNQTDKGVAFKLDGTPVKNYHIKVGGVWTEYNITNTSGYLIYRKDGFTNFTPNASVNVVPLDDIMKTISRDIKYEIMNQNKYQFQINIPNDKPTNRIFVYQSSTNKLVHITDYIPKGTTQTLIINYENVINNITSSVIPVNPLPVPEFGDSKYMGNKGTGEQGYLTRHAVCSRGKVVNNVGFAKNECPVRLIDFNCKNAYETNNVFNKMRLQDNGWIRDLVLGFNNDDKNRTGGCSGEHRTLAECPANSIISGFKQFGNTTHLSRVGMYCASPSIPKDWNPAIKWSTNTSNMIEGGSELYGSRKNYVCRVSRTLGKFHSNTCYIGNGSSYSIDYELAEAMEPLVWKDKSQVPSNKKIEGGINEADDVITYICRATHDGDVIPGKEYNNKCYIQSGGKEIGKDTYELLSRQ